MKYYDHFQHYAIEAKKSPFWAILTVCAAVGIITLMALYAAGVLIK
jgi:hypothetical protein